MGRYYTLKEIKILIYFYKFNLNLNLKVFLMITIIVIDLFRIIKKYIVGKILNIIN